RAAEHQPRLETPRRSRRDPRRPAARPPARLRLVPARRRGRPEDGTGDAAARPRVNHPDVPARARGSPQERGRRHGHHHRRTEDTLKCDNCEKPIRRTETADGINPDEYRWVHDDGNPVCALGSPVASPGGDGNGPAPVIGYLADGKFWRPDEVTVV